MNRITGTLHKDQYTFLFISHSFLTRMWNISDKSRRENQHSHFISVTFFFENPTDYEIMWKNTVEPCRPQMTIQHMRIVCWIPKAKSTHSEYVTFVFHCNNGCTNARECYVTRT
jgi:hypothetical protein